MVGNLFLRFTKIIDRVEKFACRQDPGYLRPMDISISLARCSEAKTIQMGNDMSQWIAEASEAS